MRGCALTLILLLACASGWAATNTASSGSWADVSNAVYNASTGDTVLIPASSNAWSATLLIDKAITLQGDSRDTTIITNIQNNTSKPVLRLETVAAGTIYVDGIWIHGLQQSEGIYVIGDTNYYSFIIRDCRFTECNVRAVNVEGLLAGLVYNNEFVDNKKSCDTYAGTAMQDSWSLPYTIGTTNMVVYEDNSYTFTLGNWMAGSSTAVGSHGQGGRSAWRYNTMTNLEETMDWQPVIDWHGNQVAVVDQADPTAEPPGGTTAGIRGTRHSEFYYNTAVSEVGANNQLTTIRGGTLLVWSNTFIGNDMATAFKMYEEDAPSYNDFLTNYPGYDQHRLFLWGNTSRGTLISTGSVLYADSWNFILGTTNMFFAAPSSDDWGVDPYTPLAYPHPLRSGELVATPEFSPAAGSYQTSVEVTLTCSTSGATIYYTSDGSTPDATDTEYSAAFTLTSTTTVKAIGIKAGLDDSAVASAIYTITSPAISGSATVNSVRTGTLTVR